MVDTILIITMTNITISNGQWCGALIVSLNKLLNTRWMCRWFKTSWRLHDVALMETPSITKDWCNPRLHNHSVTLLNKSHDDVMKWKHFPRYWPFVRGIHRSPVNSPHKDQWRGALMFSLICTWTNGWVNNREAGDLRRHCAHHDVTVMSNFFEKIPCSSYF